jgi:hypothetical protein
MTSLEEQSAPQKPSFIFKLLLTILVVFLPLAGLKFLQVQELLQKVLSWVADLGAGTSGDGQYSMKGVNGVNTVSPCQRNCILMTPLISRSYFYMIWVFPLKFVSLIHSNKG